MCLLPKRYTIIKIKARSCYMSYYQLKKEKREEKKRIIFSSQKRAKTTRKEGCTLLLCLKKKKVEIKTFDDINAYEYVIYD